METLYHVLNNVLVRFLTGMAGAFLLPFSVWYLVGGFFPATNGEYGFSVFIIGMPLGLIIGVLLTPWLFPKQLLYKARNKHHD